MSLQTSTRKSPLSYAPICRLTCPQVGNTTPVRIRSMILLPRNSLQMMKKKNASQKLLAAILFSAICLTLSVFGSEEGHRASYYKDGEIHINILGQPESKPLTKGHWDFKPSWSKTGDKLVFFRRLVHAKEVHNWKTPSVSSMPMGQVPTKSLMAPTRTLTRPGPGMAKIPPSGIAGNQEAEVTESWPAKSVENLARKFT